VRRVESAAEDFARLAQGIGNPVKGEMTVRCLTNVMADARAIDRLQA
jgi:hypothetical protein